jgi:Uma2 family endonuclease
MAQGATTTKTPPRSARTAATEPPIALAVPAGVRLQVSDDDFSALCGVNSDLRLERTAQGDLIVMAPAGSDSGGRNAVLTGRLYIWAAADGAGVSFDSSAGFRFPNGATRAPDASWIRNDRWNALAPEQKR